MRLDDIDLVAICVPPKWHIELLLQALSRGKHVLIEKPLAMNLREADLAVAAAADSSSVVGVALMHRYQPVYSAVRDLVRTGALGPLQQVRLTLGRNMYGDSRFCNPAGDPRSWLVNHSIAGGGMLMSSSIHFLSVVSFILGDPQATHVSGRVRQSHPAAFPGIEDEVDLLVQWEGGVQYVHQESWVTDRPYRAEVLGDTGQLVITDEGHSKLSLQGKFSQSLSPQQQAALNHHPDTSPPQESDDPVQSLFCSLWSDVLESIHLRACVPRLPGLRHARNMQAIVSAAYRAEAAGQVCPVDWLPETNGTMPPLAP